MVGTASSPAGPDSHKLTIDDQQPFDLEQIAAVLALHGVRYVLIGAASGALHGMTEYLTKDVDLLIQSDQENRTRLAAALAELGTDATISAADLATNTQWDTNAGHVDVLLTATGPNETFFIYADFAARAEVFEVGAGSVTVTAASLDDIIRMKEAADRWKDHLALPELRRLRGDAHPDRAAVTDPFEFDIEDGAD